MFLKKHRSVPFVWKEKASQVSPPPVEPVGHNIGLLIGAHLASPSWCPQKPLSVVSCSEETCEKLQAASQLSNSWTSTSPTAPPGQPGQVHMETESLFPVKKAACLFNRASDWKRQQTEARTLISESSRGPQCWCCRNEATGTASSACVALCRVVLVWLQAQALLEC